MRRLVQLIGVAFVALGIICVLGGSMVPTVNPSAAIRVVDRHRHDLGRLADLLPRPQQELIVRRISKFKAAVTAHLQALGPAPWLLYLCDVR